jgi:glycosyltransferase involved in cell wall biosynthesis
LKILLIHNTYQQPGGEDVVVEQEFQLLKRNRHDVMIYRRSNHEISSLTSIQKLRLLQRIISADDARSEVRDLLRTHKPDIVHVHNTFMMISPSVYQACVDERVPVVQTLHNYRLLCPGSTFYRDGHVCEDCMEHSLLSSVRHGCYRESHLMTAASALMLKTHRVRKTWNTQVDSYIALTRFAKRKFIDGGFPADKIHVKANFVEVDPGMRTYPGNYALFVGRLSEEKGLLTLLDAWERLPKIVPLVIVGEGPLRSRLESEVEKRKLQDIQFRGWLKRDEVRAAMKEAAFLVFPSVWYETFGMTVTEAFASGTPVLGSRLGAIEEIIDNGVNGLHFEPGNANDFAKKIAWAWEHLIEMETMGRAARRTYQAQYTAEKSYAALMDIYQSAIQQRVERATSPSANPSSEIRTRRHAPPAIFRDSRNANSALTKSETP